VGGGETNSIDHVGALHVFEFLNDPRVMMRVDRLAHLGLVFRLGRINVRLHEVQQLRPITLAALRRLKQGKLMIGNDYSFKISKPGPMTSSDSGPQILNAQIRLPVRMPGRWCPQHPPIGEIPVLE
jgi:hypothetical protein